MGQAGSVEQLTQEGIRDIKDVKDTDAMMNVIFRYMIRQINVNDFMKLSEPETCKEYVISLAQHLSSQFSRLQIMPYREKKSDVLLFKKYSELDPSKKSDAHPEIEKKSLCLLLSYYYVRIFQIYGALAITLLNDISSSQTALSSSLMPTPDRRVNQTPGYEPTTVAHIKTWGGAQKEDIRASLFSFMNSYLVEQEPYSATKGWRTIYDVTKPNGGRVFFDKVATSTSGGVPSDIGRLIIYPPATNDRYLLLELTASLIKGTNEDVSLTYKSLKSSDGKSIDLPDSLKVKVSLRRTIGSASPFMVHVEEGKNSVTTMDLAHYFQGVFQELIANMKGKSTAVEADVSISEKGVPEPLKIGTIKKALEERRTAGHCIARALQLLRTVPSAIPGGPLSYESDMCMEKFSFTARKHTGEVTTPATNPGTRGIPTYGESLLKEVSAGSRGFHSLVQLFYDTIRIGSPQIIMGDQSFTEYQAFMKTMADLYRDDLPSATPQTSMSAGLAMVRNIRDNEMCKTEGLEKGKPVRIDPTVVNVQAVSEVVRELYAIQVKHAKRCGEIYKDLFYITYDEKKNPLTISLSKNLLQGGFEELHRINDRARNVLIDYYSMCEQKYVKGVHLIVEPMRAARAARAPLGLQRSVTDPRDRPATAPLFAFPPRAAAPAAALAPTAALAPAPSRLAIAPVTVVPTRPPTARAQTATKALAVPTVPAVPKIPVVTKVPLATTRKPLKAFGGTRKRHVMRQ